MFATLIPATLPEHWMPSHPFLLTASLDANAGRFRFQTARQSHGETVSVEDPHRQPHAPSRNADAELRLRSAIVGRSGQTTGFPDVNLRLQDRRRRAGLLRFRLWPARASRGD